MSRFQNWTDDQEIERLWHGDCANMYSEETKQITYAHRMRLFNDPQDGHWPCYDLGGRSVIDIGGGPASLLLKCVNAGRRLVVDPCDYPCWVQRRYEEVGIHLIRRAAEDLPPLGDYDEAWIYNCLQHTRDPEVIVRKARETARVVRIFEWLDTPPSPGHPQTLRAALLDDWLEGTGTIERLEGENSCVGLAYYGVFKGV